MLFWVSRQILLSVIVVVLIHSIYTFLQETLTTPKIRDMVNRPVEQYKEIYNTLSGQSKSDLDKGGIQQGGIHVKGVTPGSMKNELQDYLRELSDTVVPSVSRDIYDTGNFQTI